MVRNRKDLNSLTGDAKTSGPLARELRFTVLRVFRDKSTLIMELIAAVALILLMWGPTTTVVLRALRQPGIPGLVESSEVLFGVTALLGLPVAQRLGAHVSTSVLTDRMRPPLRQWLKGIAYTLVILWVTVFLLASVPRAFESVLAGEARYGLHPVALWPARVSLAVGLFLLLLYLVVPRNKKTNSEEVL